MSLEVPGEDEEAVEDEEEEAVREERRRRRWKKVSMSPEIMEQSVSHLLSHFLVGYQVSFPLRNALT